MSIQRRSRRLASPFDNSKIVDRGVCTSIALIAPCASTEFASTVDIVIQFARIDDEYARSRSDVCTFKHGFNTIVDVWYPVCFQFHPQAWMLKNEHTSNESVAKSY
jgi:hypothetical protein